METRFHLLEEITLHDSDNIGELRDLRTRVKPHIAKSLWRARERAQTAKRVKATAKKKKRQGQGQGQGEAHGWEVREEGQAPITRSPQSRLGLVLLRN